MNALPPLYACEFCGAEIKPDAPGTWRLVRAWVQSRKNGGANSVSLPSAPLAYACDICMKLQKYGEAPQQDPLF
jgi:hypothetical protein